MDVVIDSASVAVVGPSRAVLVGALAGRIGPLRAVWPSWALSALAFATEQEGLTDLLFVEFFWYPAAFSALLFFWRLWRVKRARGVSDVHERLFGAK